jgi:hypothetical protein
MRLPWRIAPNIRSSRFFVRICAPLFDGGIVEENILALCLIACGNSPLLHAPEWHFVYMSERYDHTRAFLKM